MRLVLVILAVARIVVSVVASGEQQECLANQFYHEPRASCRNCTEIGHLFHSYQDWLGVEVIGAGATTTNSKPSAIDTSRAKFGAADGELLSRLIGPLEPNQGGGDESNVVPANNGDDGQDEEQEQQQQPQQHQQRQSQPEGGLGEGSNHNQNQDGLRWWTKRAQRLVTRLLLSQSVGNDLLEAVEQCRQHQNQSACQMWSNLCTATMYAYSDSATSNSPSFRPYRRQQQKASSTRRRRGWQECGEQQFGFNSVCNSLRDWWRLERKPQSVDIMNIYAPDEPLSSKAIASSGLLMRLNQPIQLLAYKYTYGGRFVGVEQFNLDQLERFCSAWPQSRHLDGNLIRVGKSMELRCSSLELPSVSPLNETIFIDLYLGYQQNGAFFVKPVPILVKTLLYNGEQINRKHLRDSTRWKLVHRFFFHSLYSLAEPDVGGEVVGDVQVEEDQAVVYAKSVHLELKFRRLDKGALLSSVLLTLDYDYYVISGGGGNRSQQQQPITEIMVSQTLSDMLSYKKDLDLVLTILSILSSVWCLLKCYHIQKCHGLVRLDLESLFRFLVISCDTLGNLFAIVTLTFAGTLFVAFKLQFPMNLQVLGPPQDLEDALAFNIQLAFAFKAIGLAHILYNPLNADIFFVDWERPKMLTSGEILQHLSHYNHHQKQPQPSASGEQPQQPDHSTGGQNNHLASISTVLGTNNNPHSAWTASSSFWRPYTIINKWLRMQTFRRHNTTLLLFLFVLVIQLIEVTQLATIDPHFGWTKSSSLENNLLKPTTSQTFRFFLLAFIYLSLSGAQVAAKKYLLEPTLGNKVHEFIDLCSVANVSLFCMLYPKFGYYLHGRNANGSGECGIAEMNALLEREERDLCSKRGLAPNSDQQSFVLILPRIINDHYRKLLCRDQHFTSAFLAHKQSLLRSVLSLSPSSPISEPSFSSARSSMESVAARNKAINQFLTNFLEHIYKDIDYSIRERRRFESSFLSMDMDYMDEEGPARTQNTSSTRSGGGVGGGGGGANSSAMNKSTPATFCKDPGNSFVSLIWLGHEWHLILFELLTLLWLDVWLGPSSLATTTAPLVWLLHQLLKRLYVACAKRNLVAKAMLDEKFLEP